jgi:hypothetical protein
MTHPRHTNAYITTAAEWLKTRQDLRCHWCHKPTYTNVRAGHPLKATVDHLAEVDAHPELAMNQGLWVVACWTCNAARGARYVNRKRRRQSRTPSRQW